MTLSPTPSHVSAAAESGVETAQPRPTTVLPPALVAWLTVERAAYVALALVALGLRFFELGLHPLTPAEAHQALLAWQLAHGMQPEMIGGVSPLLLSLNRLLFLLTMGSDALARVWPALAGALLCVLPYGLRRQFGRGAALISSLLLTLSPTLVASARQVDGASLAAAALLAGFVGLVRLFDGEDDTLTPGTWWGRPELIGIALAAAMISAAGGVTGVLALVLGVALFARTDVDGFAARLGTLWRRAALPAALTFVLGSTFLLIFWPGLGAAGDVLGQWLAHLRPADGAPPLLWPLVRLVGDEPFVLLGGLLCAGFWFLRRDVPRTWAVRTVGLRVGLALVQAFLGRQPGDLAQIVLPLIFLAGLGFDRLLRHLMSGIRDENNGYGPWREEWLVLGSSLVLTVTLFFYFSVWTRPDQDAQFLIAALVLLALIVLLLGLAAFWLGVRPALALLAVYLAVLTGFIQVRGLWMLNFDTLIPRERAVAYRLVSSPDVRTLTATLHDRSAHRYGDDNRYHVDIVEGPDREVLQWYLRDFDQVRVVMSADVVTPPDAVVAAMTVAPEPPLPDFVGAPFEITKRWTPDGLAGRGLWRWFLYAEAPTPAGTSQVILWVPAMDNNPGG